MLRAGAVGYIIKGDDSEEIYKVIRRVAISRIPDPVERPFS
jgi:DNA-binding NarL/FixJ family response regulator